jgi:hypothetical protein
MKELVKNQHSIPPVIEVSCAQRASSVEGAFKVEGLVMLEHEICRLGVPVGK